MPLPPIAYQPDLLGNDFEQTFLLQPDDYEGPVRSTLVRKRLAGSGTRAVLYVHGFNDYFFQREMAEEYLAHGYHFYALDLRKYGRSLLSHQHPNNVRKLREYYADLDAALAVVQAEGSATIVLSGHSTGGLVAALYAADGARRTAVAALVLNSPFLAMNQPWLVRRVVIPVAAALGRLLPAVPAPGKLPTEYGRSLHQQYQGAWDYELAWKPIVVFPVTLGWLRAIQAGHRRVRDGLAIAPPVLVLHAARTVTDYHNLKEYFTADGVLQVRHIRGLAPRLGPHVTVVAIENGIHDLVLSRPAVRTQVYQRLFAWLAEALPASGE